jgi:hypothetical protein
MCSCIPISCRNRIPSKNGVVCALGPVLSDYASSTGLKSPLGLGRDRYRRRFVQSPHSTNTKVSYLVRSVRSSMKTCTSLASVGWRLSLIDPKLKNISRSMGFHPAGGDAMVLRTYLDRRGGKDGATCECVTGEVGKARRKLRSMFIPGLRILSTAAVTDSDQI